MAAVTAAVAGVVSAGYGIYQGIEASNAAEANLAHQKDVASQQLAFQAQQQKKLDAQKEIYRNVKFTNPYAENVYEDLTVNQQQAQFQAQQGAQQRANIMQNLSGAAGSSGIAGLAQAMANQGQLQTQQISASIGQQEAANQMARAKGAQQRQMGEDMLQQREMQRQATLLGMEMGEMSGARAGVQQASANVAAAGAAQTQAHASMAGSMMGAAGGLAGAAAKMYTPTGTTVPGASGGVGGSGPQFNMAVPSGTSASGAPLTVPVVTPTGPDISSLVPGASDPKPWSDRRLKKNIKKISKSPSGLNIYSFEFKDSKYGEGVFQGVMSDEIPKEAVTRRDGYDTVDYSKLDVEFKQI